MSTIQYRGELAVVTCWCGMAHAVPTQLRDHQLRQHRDGRQVPAIYCPLGHSYIPAGDGEAKRLEKQLQAERARRDQISAELRETNTQLASERAKITKLKRRVSKGACPCCNRYFVKLDRHMQSKHPDFSQNQA